jgi:hypothetical protein
MTSSEAFRTSSVSLCTAVLLKKCREPKNNL